MALFLSHRPFQLSFARAANFCFHHRMPKASLAAIVDYCDRILHTAEVQDYKGAVNGLQVENRGSIHRLAAAVDGSLATARLAVQAGADLLLVHHGLFWNETHPWTGQRYQLLSFLLAHDLAVYSSHLPLDAHRTLGNNAQLCSALGLKGLKPFFFSHHLNLGLQAAVRIPLSELAGRLQRATGFKPLVIAAGPRTCRKVGVVTGGAGAELKQAAAEGVDTFITGEGPHWTYSMAEDLGINVLYGGHYATETFGVKALAAHLSRRYKLPWTFVDHPTGL
jgi:dinuclear metal center YbgI/SA1388 family protein